MLLIAIFQVIKFRSLFEHQYIGERELWNRFVRSATYEGIAGEGGKITPQLLKLYKRLAKGFIGLIVTGHMYVHPLGKAAPHQIGIWDDSLLPGLRELVETVKNERGDVAFQLSHAGMSTSRRLISSTPLAPSSSVANPVTSRQPKEMCEEDILEVIDAFTKAALRVVDVEADAIQIHAAHGYLLGQFLSPFFNHRHDDWGGSAENRFRLLKEIVLSIKKVVPSWWPLIVKLNTHDWIPKGITPSLAATYAKWLEELGVDAIELSGGTVSHSVFNMCRGEIPVKEISQAQPERYRSVVESSFKNMIGKYELQEAYNLEAAKIVAESVKKIPIILVGGFRKVDMMNKILNENPKICFISMCRPFIKNPSLVLDIESSDNYEVSCTSCNRCLAAVSNDLPIRCYEQGFPKKKI